MNYVFATINAFIEDTCVISVFAYLLTRIGSLGTLAGSRLMVTNRWKFGLVLGLIGLTETVFPEARFPYVTNTLIGTYAAFLGGVEVGAIALGVMTVGNLLWQPTAGILALELVVALSVLVGLAIRRIAQGRFQIIAGLVAGMLVQAIITLAFFLFPGMLHAHSSVQHAWVSIPANGFGLVLLLLIVQQVEHEVQVRAESERNRLEAEHSRALLAEAQIVALRARVHPHFLYNTLTSIASLCRIDADRAQTAIVRLGEIMRRALEGNTRKTVSLQEELEFVKGYVWIEQQRLQARLQVEWDVHPAYSTILVPSFSMQTLVENAINHGVAPQPEAGRIRISVHSFAHHVLIAVADNGVGMAATQRESVLTSAAAQMHGLQLLNQQLIFLYGDRSRLRVFSRSQQGTLVAFAIPRLETQRALRVANDAKNSHC